MAKAARREEDFRPKESERPELEASRSRPSDAPVALLQPRGVQHAALDEITDYHLFLVSHARDCHAHLNVWRGSLG